MPDQRSGDRSREVRDRESWPHHVGPFEAFGQRYAVLTSDAHLARLVLDLWALMSASAGSAEREVVYRVAPPYEDGEGVVLHDDELTAVRRDPASLLRILQWAVYRQAIEAACQGRLLLHAWAVDRGGAAVILPAAMEAGKTTMIVGLTDRGCAYLTDQPVAVGPGLEVEKYPKPLTIDHGSWEVLGHHRPRVEEELAGYFADQWYVLAQRLAPVVRRSRLFAMVFPCYEAEATTSLERLTPGGAVVVAARCTLTRFRTTLPLSRLCELGVVDSSLPAYRLVAGDLAEASEAVLAVLRDDATAVTRCG